jgi:hypothetical protein
MNIPDNVLRSYRWFREHGTVPVKHALDYAYAEAWAEDNEDSVRIKWLHDPDPDWSYLDQEDCYSKKCKEAVLKQYHGGDLLVMGCVIEILKVTPACAHCGRSETRVWEEAAGLWGIQLLGWADPYKRWQTAELLLEAMPDESYPAQKERAA